ncbi:hypothetical protein NADFUDRAFT_42631 [Nadsonia fulvescens var. elongata DSM 6958]|uniref:Uncharacterized protein n=1 Tax=Nadsonia fulvescens var. elongata DSM 6958 TaxID=857566 RepID=A0A1E3PIV2_9ASCO|nr:hypothetical protein NADFUDRAFT_42631 [Nadsonia fulvescens var. elongata DSM 6958]
MGKIVPYRDNDNNNNIHNQLLSPVHKRFSQRPPLTDSENKENIPVYGGTHRGLNHHQKPYSKGNVSQYPSKYSTRSYSPSLADGRPLGSEFRPRNPLSAKPTIGSSSLTSSFISVSSTLRTAVTAGYSIFEPSQKLTTEFVYTQSELANPEATTSSGTDSNDSNIEKDQSPLSFTAKPSSMVGSPMRNLPLNGMVPSINSFSPRKPSASTPTSSTSQNHGYRNSNGTKKKMVFMR